MKSLGLIETKGLLPAIECADVMVKAADVRLLGRTCIGAGLVSVSVTGDVAAVKAAVDAAKAALQQLNADAFYASHVIPRPDEDVFNGILNSAFIGSKAEEQHDVELKNVVLAETEESKAEEQNEDVLSSVEQLNAEFTKPEKGSDKATPENPPTSAAVTTPAVAKCVVKDVGKRSESTPATAKPALTSAGQIPLASEPKKAPVVAKKAAMNKKDVDALWAAKGADGIHDGLNKLTLAKLRVLAREYPDLPIESKKLSKVKKRSLVEVFKRYYATLEK